MAATTAYPTSNSPFHPHSFTPPRTQFSPVSRRASSSSSSISHISQLSITRTMKNDENNNEQMIEDRAMTPTDNDVLYIAMDTETDDSEEDDPIIINNNNNIDEEQFLSFVGLRRKTKKSVVRKMNLLPLTKRLACPVCLLPLPKYGERVRQALNIRLPFLKYLRFIIDIERFCSTDVNARAQSLLPRSAQRRGLSAKNRSPRKEKLLKTGKYVERILVVDRTTLSRLRDCVSTSVEHGHRVDMNETDISLPFFTVDVCRNSLDSTMKKSLRINEFARSTLSKGRSHFEKIQMILYIS